MMLNKQNSTTVFITTMVAALAVSASAFGAMDMQYMDMSESKGARSHINLNIGSKMINPGDKFTFYENKEATVLNYDLERMRSQTQFGLDVDYKVGDLPFYIAVGYHASSSKEGIHTLNLSELRLGARKYQNFDAFAIYYGGGFSSVTAKLERDSYVTKEAVTGEEAEESLADYEASDSFTAYRALAGIAADEGKHHDNDNKEKLDAIINTASDKDDEGVTVRKLDSAIAAYGSVSSPNVDVITRLNELKDKYGEGGTTYSTLVSSEREADVIPAVSETASTLGFYGEVGGLYKVTKSIYVGANLTYTSAMVEFEKFSDKKEKMDVGGAQIGLVVGYAF